MGKSYYKSRKRRSPSTDHLAGLKEKMCRLINTLSQREVRAHSGRFPFSSRSLPVPQEDLGSRNELESTFRSDSEVVLVPLVRQEELTDPEFAGVYDIAGSVCEKYRRHDDTIFLLFHMFGTSYILFSGRRGYSRGGGHNLETIQAGHYR